MSDRFRAPFVAIAASIGLIVVYLGFGGASYDPASVEDPCQARDLTLVQDRSLFEALALSSLDGAACDLHVSREELTLALADESATQQFADAHQIDSADVEDAVRAGLVRAVDDAAAAGRVDGIEVAILRKVAENAPVGTTISALQALPGDDNIQSLLERLGSLQDLGIPDLPGLSDIPGYEGLNGLIP